MRHAVFTAVLKRLTNIMMKIGHSQPCFGTVKICSPNGNGAMLARQGLKVRPTATERQRRIILQARGLACLTFTRISDAQRESASKARSGNRSACKEEARIGGALLMELQRMAGLKGYQEGKHVSFRYSAPDGMEKKISAEQAALVDRHCGDNVGENANPPGWLALVRCLPDGLRAALLLELHAGNYITEIATSDWPNEGSIVVTAANRFTAARRQPPPGVLWSQCNDPHYWREDLSQKAKTVEFLIIT